MRWQGNIAGTFLVKAFVCLALAAPVLADAQDHRSREYSLDVRRQPLTPALIELSRETGVSYAHSPKTPEEEQILVGPLNGSYTIDAALTELLRSTELTFRWTTVNTVLIEPRPSAPKESQPFQQSRAPLDKPTTSRRNTGDQVLYWVVTTGRSQLHSLPRPTAPGLVLDREAIQRTGLATVAEVLRLIPQQPFLRPDGFRTNGAQYAELRGLGSNTTLVLIDGRRAFASAGSFIVDAFDLNQLPLAAVERVEVQLDSISVRHGADAPGGIVNVVLRDDVPVTSIEAHYGAAAGGGEQRQMSLSTGYRGDDVAATLILDYRDVSALLGDHRDLWRDQDYRRFGGADMRSPVSIPGNIYATQGPLFPSGATFAAIPEHTSSPVTDRAEFRPFALNLDSLLRYSPIVPQDRRASAVASVHGSVNATLAARADLMIVDRRVAYGTLPPVVTNAVVPQTNPFNAFDQPVMVTGLLDDTGRTQATLDSLLVRGSGALRGTIAGWDWDLSLVRSEEDARSRVDNVIDPERLALVLNESDPNRTLNLLGPGPAGSREVVASVMTPDVDIFATDATQLTGVVNGKLLTLPAGPVETVVGAEWRKESVQFDSLYGAFAREVAASFAELQIPLLSENVQPGASRELTLTLAGRLDRYTDFGEIFSPQYGLLWRPSSEVAFRVTYARSFRAPSLYDLYLPRVVGAAVPIADPRRGGEAYSVDQVGGGTRDLGATHGKSFAVGIELTPQALQGLALSATYWHVKMKDPVITPNATSILAQEAQLAERVLRAEPTTQDAAAGLPGRILAIDVSRMNFGRVTTSGIDLGAGYEFETAAGRFATDLKATWVDEYEALDLPGRPVVDRVDVAHELGTITKWRAIASLDWQHGPFGATAYVRYIPSYDDTREGARNGRTVPSQTFLDLQVSADVGDLLGTSHLLRGVEFTAGALNVFDELPPFAEVGGLLGYDNSQGDLKGRFWYLRLGKAF